MRLSVLVENESENPDLKSEHGISIWVETANANVLFDTGASSAFAENADRLGIDIARADALVLSHAHADHTGGLATFFERNRTAPVYVGPGITESRFSVRGSGRRSIGLDPAVYEAHVERFRNVSGQTELAPGVGVSVVSHRHDPAPSGNEHLYRKSGEKLQLDPFEEELFLWVEEESGIHVVTGCSHSGIINIVREASAHGKVLSVTGGFHLKGEDKGRVRDIAAGLSDLETVYTGHCTGKDAYRMIRESLGDRAHYASTGTRAEL
jgi:7,8-dihydropterin-6-yl-methyl-4-(beta-D-ribofuranosyl)aminobenzene 5'-phosphate synthase